MSHFLFLKLSHLLFFDHPNEAFLINGRKHSQKTKTSQCNIWGEVMGDQQLYVWSELRLVFRGPRVGPEQTPAWTRMLNSLPISLRIEPLNHGGINQQRYHFGQPGTLKDQFWIERTGDYLLICHENCFLINRNYFYCLLNAIYWAIN